MAISRCHSMDFPYAHGNMIFVQHDVWHDVLLAKQCHKPPIWNHMKSYDIIWFSLHPCVQMLSPWGWWIIICFTMLYKPIRWYIYISYIYISYIYISYIYIIYIYIIYIIYIYIISFTYHFPTIYLLFTSYFHIVSLLGLTHIPHLAEPAFGRPSPGAQWPLRCSWSRWKGHLSKQKPGSIGVGLREHLEETSMRV